MEEKQEAWATQREEMVRLQLQRRGIVDLEVLRAMAKVPRHLFVPKEERALAYQDQPLEIGWGQTISQPYMVALMSESLQVETGAKVLEIGAGSGYQSAVLLELGCRLYTVERIAALVELARSNLKAAGYNDFGLFHQDGYEGYLRAAPFGGILVAAAAPALPVELVMLLKPGARMVIPVGVWDQELLEIRRTEQGYRIKRLGAVRFVPLLHGLA